MSDNVNHPSHYNKGGVEVAFAMDLILGSTAHWFGHALKYTCRAPHKGKLVEDLRKAVWCARRGIGKHPSQGGFGAPAHLQDSLISALAAGFWQHTPEKYRRNMRGMVDSIVRGDIVALSKWATALSKTLEADDKASAPPENIDRTQLAALAANNREWLAESVHLAALATNNRELRTRYDALTDERDELQDELDEARGAVKSLMSQRDLLLEQLQGDDRHRKVAEFAQAVGAYTATTPSVPPFEVRVLRARLTMEEAFEAVGAMFGVRIDAQARAAEVVEYFARYYVIHSDVDVASVAKELADLDYITEGNRQAFGIYGPPVFAEVHRSNMSKANAPKDAHGKVMKDDSYSPANLQPIIDAQKENKP